MTVVDRSGTGEPFAVPLPNCAPESRAGSCLSPKSAAPRPVADPVRNTVIGDLAGAGFRVVAAPPGFLATESLVAALRVRGVPLVWLRVAPEDKDPATLLLSTLTAARRLSPAAGEATLARIRRSPGPIAGWPPLYRFLAEELAQDLPAETAFVVDQAQHLLSDCASLGLLCGHLLAHLPDTAVRIVLSHAEVPPAVLPEGVERVGVERLRLDERQAGPLIAGDRAGWRSGHLRRALAVSGGRQVLVTGLAAAGTALGIAFVQRSLDQATSLDALLTHIARTWLASAGEGSLKALSLLLLAEYGQSPLFAHALGSAPLSGAHDDAPWLQPLEDGWIRPRTAWIPALRAATPAVSRLERSEIARSAAWFATHGAWDKAVSLAQAHANPELAAELLAEQAPAMLRHGQWLTLNEHLRALPEAQLKRWPVLSQCRGELALIDGDVDAARGFFGRAGDGYIARHDAAGATQSLLAESAIAAWGGNAEGARTQARAALALAEGAGLPAAGAWAAWQLGVLAVAAGTMPAALSYLTQATSLAQIAGDHALLDRCERAASLVAEQEARRQDCIGLRRALVEAEAAERAARGRLRLRLAGPEASPGLDPANDGAGVAGNAAPLMARLPAPQDHAPASEPGGLTALLSSIGLRRQARPIDPSSPSPESTWLDAVWAVPLGSEEDGLHAANALDDGITESDEARENASTRGPSEGKPPLGWLASLGASRRVPPIGRPRLTPGLGVTGAVSDSAAFPAEPGAAVMGDFHRVQRAGDDPPIRLVVHLLGEFRTRLDEVPVRHWPSGRGRAVFKYLLVHRERPLSRDVLMDVFWPDTSPDAARNSLNVALHGLRQALRPVSTLPVVVYDAGSYRLNPDLPVWIDIEAFERHLAAGRSLESEGLFEAAVAAYEAATALYQDDFMADDPYEDWALLIREKLRISHLDALDRLSHIYLGQGRYAASAEACQRILAADNCREEAHRRLMRAYARQGQHHLALRQFQVCVEALEAELAIVPAEATRALAERIRGRQQV